MKRLLLSALLATAPFAFAESVPGKIEFEGLIQSMPTQGLKGEWKVAGRTVVFGDGTVLKEKDGKAVVGKKVEVEGILEKDGKITAMKIETED